MVTGGRSLEEEEEDEPLTRHSGDGAWYVFDEITERKKEVKMCGKATSSWTQR